MPKCSLRIVCMPTMARLSMSSSSPHGAFMRKSIASCMYVSQNMWCACTLHEYLLMHTYYVRTTQANWRWHQLDTGTSVHIRIHTCGSLWNIWLCNLNVCKNVCMLYVHCFYERRCVWYAPHTARRISTGVPYDACGGARMHECTHMQHRTSLDNAPGRRKQRLFCACMRVGMHASIYSRILTCMCA